MQPFDLALRLCLGFLADLWVKRPSGVLLKLLLPGIDLVRMHLIALGQVGDSRFQSQRSRKPDKSAGS